MKPTGMPSNADLVGGNSVLPVSLRNVEAAR